MRCGLVLFGFQPLILLQSVDLWLLENGLVRFEAARVAAENGAAPSEAWARSPGGGRSNPIVAPTSPKAATMVYSGEPKFAATRDRAGAMSMRIKTLIIPPENEPTMVADKAS